MAAAETAQAGRLAGDVCLVTGASRGIGFAVAERLAREGATVVATARTQGGLEELDDAIQHSTGRNATLLPLDITDGDQVDRLGPSLYERFGRLDVLVGNAGALGNLSPIAHGQPQDWQHVFNVNVLANQRLVRTLDPLLRGGESGRAIFVTSGVTRSPRAYFSPYAASKLALEHLALTYAAEVQHSPLKVNLLDPGVVRTRMRAHAFPGEDPQSLPPPEAITEDFVGLAARDCRRHGERVEAKPRR